jgi:hypothetical protein
MALKFKKTKKRVSWQTIFLSMILGALSLMLIAFLGVSNWKIKEKREDLNLEIEKAREQVQILQERKASLAAGLSESEKENFQEERIREQGYKLPGEEVFAVLGSPKPPAAEQPKPEEQTFWQTLWEKIKNMMP